MAPKWFSASIEVGSGNAECGKEARGRVIIQKLYLERIILFDTK